MKRTGGTFRCFKESKTPQHTLGLLHGYQYSVYIRPFQRGAITMSMCKGCKTADGQR